MAISSTSPSVGASSVLLDSDISVSFSENIQRGSGNILLKTWAGKLIETYSQNSTNISIIGNNLSINPTANFNYNTGYRVIFENASVKTVSSNSNEIVTPVEFTTEIRIKQTTDTNLDFGFVQIKNLTLSNPTQSTSNVKFDITLDDLKYLDKDITAIAVNLNYDPTDLISSTVSPKTIGGSLVYSPIVSNLNFSTNVNGKIVALINTAYLSQSVKNSSDNTLSVDFNFNKLLKTFEVGLDAAYLTTDSGNFDLEVGYKQAVKINDAPTGAVNITGTPTQGQVLSASNSLADIDGIPSSGVGVVAYQWMADAVNITSATGTSFTLTQAQVGKAISVKASYIDLLGTAERVTSAATVAVANLNDAPTGSVSITGTATQGQVLTASNNLADLDGIPTSGSGAMAYQWLADGVNINNATGASFTLTQSQVGKAISVKASYTDQQGKAESVSSSATAAVANINDSTTGSAPLVSTFSPADEATAVAVGANVVVTFSAAIQRGAGNIVLKKADGTTVATYAQSSTEVTVSGSTLTINPASDLSFSTGYKVEFAAGSVQDLAGNNYAGTTSYNFTTGAAPDTTAPTITTFSPADGATGVGVASNITLTFSEPVVARSGGTIELMTDYGSGHQSVEMFSVSDATRVTINGNVVTIDPTSALLPSMGYHLGFNNALADNTGNAFSYSHGQYNFTTGAVTDTTAPTASTFSPADEATAVAIGANVVVTFSEAVQRGAGSIVLKKADGTTVATYAQSSTEVTVSGSTLTINPASDLSFSTGYKVEFAAGSVQDLTGNNYAGTTSYNFATGAAPDTTAPTITTFSPADGATGVGVASNITLTFSEPVVARNGGTIELMTDYGFGHQSVEMFSVSDATRVTINGNVVTIDPTSALLPSTGYHLGFNNALADNAGNAFSYTHGQYNFITGAATNSTTPSVKFWKNNTLTPSEIKKTEAVNLSDAIAVLKMIVGLNVNSINVPLSPYQAIAADFDQNGAVELSDAIGVLKMVVGLNAPSPAWKYFDDEKLTLAYSASQSLSPKSWTATSAVADASNVNESVKLVGVLTGDVDGSWLGQ